MTWHSVARVGAITPGDVVAVMVGDRELVLGLDPLGNAGQGRYFATQRACAHHGGDLANGIVSRGHLICPMHGWRFSTATGCHETASYCLKTYAVRVVGDDIQIEESDDASP
ncbi:MAG: Rieske 2Fe-2S domain-containing protein [Proteobacteria bacterium]|nr:Rieske 2Fe-2S domain-containing protein [Pseudomonadota bacterium]